MSEVHNMQKSIDSSLSAIDTKVSTLSSGINNLINTEGFEGQAASSVKNYNKTFHLQSIKKIGTINKGFESDVAKSIRKFQSEIDDNASTILDEDEIKEYKGDINDALKDVFKSSKDTSGAISDVSDLAIAKKIKAENLANKVGDFSKGIDQTVEELATFDTNSSIDGDKTGNLITELSGVDSCVKNMKPDRARVNSTSGEIEGAVARHKISEELAGWQTYMETLSGNLYKAPDLGRAASDIITRAGREYYVVKAVGGGSALKGYKKYLKARDINKLINKMDKNQLKRTSLVLNTDRGNIKTKNAVKMASKFARNNPFKKGNLVNWISKIQECQGVNARILKKELQDKNFKYTFGDAKKFFDTAGMKKAAVTEFKDTFVPQNTRETFSRKENLASKTALKRSMSKLWSENIKDGTKEFKLDFANKNIIDKLGKLLKLGGKALKPLGFIIVTTDNIRKKSWQEKLVGMGIDLSAIGAGVAAGTAIGTTIPLPVVGTVAGALTGAAVGIALDYRVPYLDKSVAGLAKDGINSGTNKVKSGFGKVTSGSKTVFEQERGRQMKTQEIVGNTRRAYLILLIIFVVLFSLFFDLIIYFYGNLQGKLPIYLNVFLIFAAVVFILIYFQEEGGEVKVKESNVIRYLTLNVVAGYSMILLVAFIYVFGAAGYDFGVLNYWLGIMLMLFVSWLALFLFYEDEFDSENPDKAVSVVAIIIKLSAFGGLFYTRTVVPNTTNEEKFITLSILTDIAVDLLLVRSYFNYALYKGVKKDIENGVGN